MPEKRMSRIQALRKLLNRVEEIDKKTKGAVYLSIAAIVVSILSAVFQVSFCMSCM
jgi:hypothetical protein|tara:strand:- start:318 stop:485 length:168 start_codon:yes stop_codon:yes gene_type:complete